MPGLMLTLAQAARLFSIDAVRCGRVLGALFDRGVPATDAPSPATTAAPAVPEGA
jgi:hypothetical protein